MYQNLSTLVPFYELNLTRDSHVRAQLKSITPLDHPSRMVFPSSKKTSYAFPKPKKGPSQSEKPSGGRDVAP